MITLVEHAAMEKDLRTRHTHAALQMSDLISAVLDHLPKDSKFKARRVLFANVVLESLKAVGMTYEDVRLAAQAHDRMQATKRYLNSLPD